MQTVSNRAFSRFRTPVCNNGLVPETYEAVLVLSFGGPETRDDVIPFLENVLRGRNVPRQRLLEVAEHYYHFGGKSPINAQNRELVAALETELARSGPALPVFWANRNWHPYLVDTLNAMRDAGVRRALAFVTSAFGSYSGCRQYLEDIERARSLMGPDAPVVEKLRGFFNHPGFIETMIARVQDATVSANAELIFTAHSVPVAMAESSPYVRQLETTCELVAEGVGKPEWTLAYQSRSGPPSQPWLGPDILDVLRERAAAGVREVMLAPIGFVSDHMEVLYDLDTEAADVAAELGIHLVRAATPGSHPRFVAMIRELVSERVLDLPPLALGNEPTHVCTAGCCVPPPTRPRT